ASPICTLPMPRSFCLFFFLLTPHPPRSTLFPYTTLFRSFLRLFHGIRQDRVCGMDVLPDILARAEQEGKSVYFYGTTDDILAARSEEHTSELQSRENLVCRLLLEKKNTRQNVKME